MSAIIIEMDSKAHYQETGWLSSFHFLFLALPTHRIQLSETESQVWWGFPKKWMKECNSGYQLRVGAEGMGWGGGTVCDLEFPVKQVIDSYFWNWHNKGRHLHAKAPGKPAIFLDLAFAFLGTRISNCRDRIKIQTTCFKSRNFTDTGGQNSYGVILLCLYPFSSQCSSPFWGTLKHPWFDPSLASLSFAPPNSSYTELLTPPSEPSPHLWLHQLGIYCHHIYICSNPVYFSRPSKIPSLLWSLHNSLLLVLSLKKKNILTWKKN